MSQQAYTATSLGMSGRLSELTSLWRRYRKSDLQQRIATSIAEVRSACEEISRLRHDQPVTGQDVLEVGSGQQSVQLAYFSLQNRAIGIDYEYSGDRFTLKQAIDTFRTNGTVRTFKTLARKFFGFDKSKRNAFVREMGITDWPRLDVCQMDAAQLTFPDESFDIVYSRAVFEHLSDPAAVVREIMRVLRPGGVFYCFLHLYTSDSGCHDIRIFSGNRGALPLWSHLRDDCRQLVHENTYLNRWRIDQWREMFAQAMPGSQVDALSDDTDAGHISELAKLRDSGELASYTDEELLSVTVKVTWTKPLAPAECNDAAAVLAEGLAGG